MLDRLRAVLALLVFLLGIGHLIVGLISYTAFSLDALWFTGTGVAMLCVALSNLSAQGVSLTDRLVQIFQNLIMFAYFVAAWTILPAPQVLVGLVLLGALLSIRAAELKARMISL